MNAESRLEEQLTAKEQAEAKRERLKKLYTEMSAKYGGELSATTIVNECAKEVGYSTIYAIRILMGMGLYEPPRGGSYGYQKPELRYEQDSSNR